MSPNEALTRKKLIDPALEHAGWDVSDPVQVAIELPEGGITLSPDRQRIVSAQPNPFE